MCSGSTHWTFASGRDAIAKLPLYRIVQHQIDASPEDSFEVVPQSNDLEVADRRVKFDEEIDVTLRPRLVASDRAEEKQQFDAKRTDGGFVGGVGVN